jgi:radical SAM superfamily enzyme YgiQ (UPF0313 family)
LHYEGNIIRPPSEANSIILQVTVGCSHNKCSFCGAYKDVLFRVKDDEIINDDISFAARYCKKQKRVFISDGDALILPTNRLVSIFTAIRDNLPWVNRISLYGNAKSILRKSAEDLALLKKLGLDRIYMGLESGHDAILKRISKGVSSKQMVQAADIVNEAGIFLSVTVLLGIAGVKYSQEHALRTGKVLTLMKPSQIAALTLMVLDNTPLHNDLKTGVFQVPDQEMLLQELRTLVLNIDLDRVQFQANHASNFLPLTGRLKRDKPRFLQTIESALEGKVCLREEHLRAL